MASTSQWRCSLKSQTNEATLKPSSSSSLSSSPLSRGSSVFFCFQINKRRNRITTFCLHDPASNSVKKLKSSVQVYSLIDVKEDSKLKPERNENNDREVDSKRIEPLKRQILSLESLFGKRSSWSRILFASSKVRSIVLLNVIALVYASNIPMVKEIEAVMDPAAFTAMRFGMTAIPLIPFVLRAKCDTQTRNAGIELGFWVSLGYLMEALGLVTSDAGRASFISMFTVIVVPLLDGMFGATVPARTWFGALMSIVGVAMLESSGSPPNVGDLLNFLSALFFGIHTLRTEHISKSTNKKDILPILGYEVCVVAVLSTLWYIVGGCSGGFQEYDLSSVTWTMFIDWMIAFPWVPALYTGIFSTVLCLWVEMSAMHDVSATEAAIIYGLEPVWGAAFAWFLLGERWGPTGWIGAAFVLGGSLTVQILGSSSLITSGKDKDAKKDDCLILEKQKILSASPVVVSSRNPITDLFKK